MSTFVAIVAGTATGSVLFGVWQQHLWFLGALLPLAWSCLVQTGVEAG